MKTKLLLLTLCALFLLTGFSENEKKATLEGKVIDKESGTPLDFAYVKIFQKDVLITGTQTSIDGNYLLTNIKPGVYKIQASFIGYKSETKTDVILKAGKTQKLDLALTISGVKLTDVVITEYKAPLVERCVSTSGGTITAEKIRNRTTKAVTSITACDSEVSAGDKSSMSIRGTRTDATSYIVDGIRVSKSEIEELHSPPETSKAEKTIAKDKTKEKIPADEPKTILQNLPKARQLTAGQWDDLLEWEQWKDVLKERLYKVEEKWELNPGNRFTIQVTGNLNQPLPNALIKIFDKENNELWTGKSDNNGKAELWIKDKDLKPAKIQATYKKRNKTILDIISFEDGVNFIEFDVGCQQNDMVEIMFVIDATGSMGDEISYLQSELGDIIKQLENQKHISKLHTGVVFYRDYDDDYVTKIKELSEDNKSTLSFISNNRADGGGDYPEAVEVALEDAILKQSWSKEAIARIAFVVLDAPPHNTPSVKKKMEMLSKKAAELGIKIVPVLASGSNSESEYIMRSLAMSTNSRFVFLTDDSEIGNSHKEPEVGPYDVEYLNDLLFRMIVEMTTCKPCGSQDTEIVNEKLKTLFTTKFNVSCYPVPAKDFLMVQFDGKCDRLELINSEGKILSVKGKLKDGIYSIKLQNHPAGNYFIKLYKGKKTKTIKIMKVS